MTKSWPIGFRELLKKLLFIFSAMPTCKDWNGFSHVAAERGGPTSVKRWNQPALDLL
jgi:hypothetical protein